MPSAITLGGAGAQARATTNPGLAGAQAGSAGGPPTVTLTSTGNLLNRQQVHEVLVSPAKVSHMFYFLEMIDVCLVY